MKTFFYYNEHQRELATKFRKLAVQFQKKKTPFKDNGAEQQREEIAGECAAYTNLLNSVKLSNKTMEYLNQEYELIKAWL